MAKRGRPPAKERININGKEYVASKIACRELVCDANQLVSFASQSCVN